jgi:hypothetical protein
MNEDREVEIMHVIPKVRLAIASIGLAMLFTPILRLQAQTAAAPPAPLPSQIATAKKVFISNAGVGTDKTYNEFYSAIKSWGRYELVSAPADADLVIEISFSTEISGVSGSKEFGCDSSNSSQFKLVLVDPKTRIALWTVAEAVQPSARHKTGDQLFEDGLNKIVGDLKALTAQPAAPAS